MSAVIETASLVGAYLIGGCSPGYWLVRWRTHDDVRTHGSGGTGATNVGRVLGKGGYATVLVLDAAKGALAVLLARKLQLDEAWVWACAVAAVAGHVWPPQLGFRGGRGMSTLLGAWLVLAPLALLPCAVFMLLVMPLIRKFVLSGLCGICLLPAASWWASAGSLAATLAAAACSLVVLFAHRRHLRDWLRPTPVSN